MGDKVTDMLVDVLLIAAAAHGDESAPESEHIAMVKRAYALTDRIMEKHLSDSPSKMDKQRVIVEVLEKALMIAKD